MTIWETYPDNYRHTEVQAVLRAVRAGECASVVGLSGSGKSNLLGFLANRIPASDPQLPRLALVDCNRLSQSQLDPLLSLVRRTLGDPSPAGDEWQAAERLVAGLSAQGGGLCLLFDRFDRLDLSDPALTGGLRALRDAHKYRLCYVTATRRPLDPRNELAELFYAHTLWLGPLAASDAAWSASQYAARRGLPWNENAITRLAALSGGYPSFLRAACEAHAAGAALETAYLLSHPAVLRRLDEFWADQPDQAALLRAGLEGHDFLQAGSPSSNFDTTRLTAKENLLLKHFQAHIGEVCEKDELIQAVWPEDAIYERGLRDDSLAQLVRRLREKIEPDPSNPSYIHTLPGRGYRFIRDQALY